MRTWILQRYQVYARYVLLAALALTPVVFTRKTVDVFNLTKITTLFVLVVVALAIWVVWSSERGIWVPRMRMFWIAGAFLLAEGIATITSQNRGVSLLGLYHRYGGLVPFMLYATVALLIVGLYWERPADLKEVPRTVALASVALSLYVLIQAAGLDWIPWRDSSGLPPTFPVGTMGNSNFAGGYLAIATPLFLYVVLTARQRPWKIVLGLAFAVNLLALYFTETRGAFIGFGLAGAALAFLYRENLPRWFRRLTLLGFCGAALAFIVVIFHPGMRQAPGFFSSAGALSPFRTGTFQDRSYYWITALRVFRHHPILGTGPDTYYFNYPIFRLAKDGAKLGLTITDKPHNIFFEYTADSGLIGIGSYLTMLAFAFVFGYRRVRQLEGHDRLLLMMFMATLVAYVGQGFFSIDVPPIAVMGWVAIAGIVILADPRVVAAQDAIRAAEARPVRPGQGGKKKRPVPKAARKGSSGGATRVLRYGPTRWLAHSATVVVGLLLILIGLRPYWGDRLDHTAQSLQSALQQSQAGVTTQQVAAAFLHAAAFVPLEPSYPSSAGNAWESAGDGAQDPATKVSDYTQALAPYNRALRLQPKNVFYIMNLARLNGDWGVVDASHFPTSDTFWRSAVKEDPTDWAVHENYASALIKWAEVTSRVDLRNQAVDELHTVVRIKPQDVTAWVDLTIVYRELGRTSEANAALGTAKLLAPTNPQVLQLEASSPTSTAAPGSTTGTATPNSTAGG